MSTYSAERIKLTTLGRWGLKSVKQRFQEKVYVDFDSGCWLWTAAQDGHGYGQMNVDGRPEKAYRVAYRLYVGEIPAGLSLDHLCRNRICVAPEHLEPVTLAENTRRQLDAVGHANDLKTHCRNGHPYSEENTLHVKTKVGTGVGRVCRICRAETTKRYRNKAAS